MLMKVLVSTTPATPEEVIKIKVEVTLASSLSCALPLSILLHSFLTRLIINSSFIRVWQNFVSIGNFLELCLSCLWVIPVFVWVVFDRLLLKCLLDLIFSCISFQSHNIVIIIFWFCCRLLRLLPLLLLSSTTAELLSIEPLLPTTEVEFELLGSNAKLVSIAEEVFSNDYD